MSKLYDLIFNQSRNNTFSVVYSFIGIAIAAFVYSVFILKLNIFSQLGLLISGFLFYTLTEYLIHRFILHLKGDPDKPILITKSHNHHHEFPRDDKRIDITLPRAIVLASAFFVLFWFVFEQHVFSFFSGFVAGYALYHFVHYKIHTIRPPKNFIGYLWKHHHVHHHINKTVAYGVTSPFWDIVFGTMPKNIK